MRDVNRINLGAHGFPYFLTLTYHHEWPEDPEDQYAQLKALIKRLERAWGPICGVWRREKQKRGAPHWHILFWLKYPQELDWHPLHRIRKMQNNVSWAWNEIADPGNMDHFVAGTNLQEARSVRHMNGYLSKYIAKAETLVEGERIGRSWGKIRPDHLIIEPCHVRHVTQEQFVQLRRFLARKSRQRIYCPAPSPDGTRQIYGLSAFCGSEPITRLLAWLGIIGSTAGVPA